MEPNHESQSIEPQSTTFIVFVKSPSFDAVQLDLPLLQVQSGMTIGDLKTVLADRVQRQGCAIRLILHGRILHDSQDILSAGLVQGSVLHCALSELPGRQSTSADVSAEEMRGFDRLRRSGISEDVIEHLRWQLFLNYQEDPTQLGAVPPNDPRDLEERWLNSRSSASLMRNFDVSTVVEQPGGLEAPILRVAPAVAGPRSSTDGEFTDIFVGMLFGFVLGLTTLLLLGSGVPRSRRLTFGILAGIACNISFGLIRLSK